MHQYEGPTRRSETRQFRSPNPGPVCDRRTQLRCDRLDPCGRHGTLAFRAFRVEINPLVAGSFGILIGACLGSIFGLGVTRPPIADRVRPFLQRFTSAAPTPLNFAVIGLAAALGEETLFRAAIQPAAGIVVSSLLFMLAHSLIADFRHPTIGKAGYAVLAFTMGLLLGVMYDRLGIAASMGTHFAFDTAALLVIRPLLPTIVLATPGAG